MLKKIYGCVLLLLSMHSFSQVLYSEKFNSLALTTASYTANGITYTYSYTDLPVGMFTINNGALTADTLSGNYPFRANLQKQKGWLSYKANNTNDTFAVSTSWLKPTGTADAWLITPGVANITASTVLTWEAVAPDISNSDGYEVYVSTNTSSTPTVSDFTSANRLFNTGSESNSWVTHGVSLAAYAGQSVRIAFRNNSQNKYQLWIDDITVKNIANSYDVNAVSSDTYKYSTVNTNNSISATFRNNGSTAITSVQLNYQVGNGAIFSETQTLPYPLNYQDSKQFTFLQPYSSSTAGYNTIKVWVNLINGQTDQVHVNDTAKSGITLSNSVPNKKVLVEEFTSAKCGNCPESYIRLRDAATTNTNAITASIHTNDNLTNTSGTTLTNYYEGAIPSVVIDGYYYSSGQLNTYITQRQNMKVPAEVAVTGVSYNVAARQITATVSATFTGDVKGDYRLNLYIKENNIYGPINDHSDNSWNQYNNAYNIQSSPYYQVGNYINSTYVLQPNQYQHNFVINEFLDGPFGAAGIIPVNGNTAGQTYSKAYTYTLPFAFAGEYRFNADNIYLIGVVSESNPNCIILNSQQVKLTANPEAPVGIKETTSEDFSLSLYPNPTVYECYLKYVSQNNAPVTLSVYNTLGEMIYSRSETINAGEVSQQLDCSNFPAGNYMVRLTIKDKSFSKKLTVIK